MDPNYSLDFTFDQLVATVATFIYDNCANVNQAKWSTVDSKFKTGYTETGNIPWTSFIKKGYLTNKYGTFRGCWAHWDGHNKRWEIDTTQKFSQPTYSVTIDPNTAMVFQHGISSNSIKNHLINWLNRRCDFDVSIRDVNINSLYTVTAYLSQYVTRAVHYVTSILSDNYYLEYIQYNDNLLLNEIVVNDDNIIRYYSTIGNNINKRGLKEYLMYFLKDITSDVSPRNIKYNIILVPPHRTN